MLTNEEIRQQAYGFFLEEAPDLLERIEEGMSRLKDGLIESNERNACVHELMRATHTLKGSAASVGLGTVQKIAHFLEDAVRSLYNPEVEIDAELQSLLWEGFACLRLPLTAAITGTNIDEDRAMESSTEIFVQLERKLGDNFGTGELPTSQEMGFDYIQSIFEVGVCQRLEEIEQLLCDSANPELVSQLTERFKVLADLAASFSLTGFSDIANISIEIIKKLPDLACEVGKIALKDLQNGRLLIVQGDRSQGGTPSEELLSIASATRDTSLNETSLFEQFPSNDLLTSSTNSFFSEYEENESLTILVSAELESRPPSTDQELVRLDQGLPGNSSTEEPAGNIELSESFQLLNDILDNLDLANETTQAEASSQEPSLISLTSGTISFPENPAVLNNQDLEVISSERTEPKITNTLDFRQTLSDPQPISSPPPTTQNVRVSTEVLRRLSYNIGELLVAQNRKTSEDIQLQNVYQKSLEAQEKLVQYLIQLREWGDLFLSHNIQSEVSKSFQKRGNVTTVLASGWQNLLDTMELERYTDMHVLIQAALEQAGTLELTIEGIKNFSEQSNHSMEKQQRMLTNIRDDLIEARMLPLREVFQRFPRMVEQLCTSYDKSVELQIFGENVLVDKAIAEKLYDPLLHLIRNAFDHGIEMPGERLQFGKPTEGQIIINAYQRSGYTVIEIKDDGAGIDQERIRQKAISDRLYDSETAGSLNQSQLLELLFQPGFSTTESVTNLSGRGVGLDVVRVQLQALKGDVSVYSQPKQGTMFVLQIPLTMTIGRLMLVSVGSTTYGILSEAIEQILLPKPSQIRNLEHQRVLYLTWEQEEKLIPIRKLSELLLYSSPVHQEKTITEDFHNQATSLLLLRYGDRYLALEVDRIIGEQETLIKPFDGLVSVPTYAYGCSELGDSCSYLAIDGSALISYAYNGQLLRSNQVINLPLELPDVPLKFLPSYTPPKTSKIEQNLTILIVDDSISHRRTVALVLEQEGYKIVQAIDGLDALEQLESGLVVDIVLCDIEMPRLNGFEFLNRCRTNSALKQLPVIMLTSRTPEKHRHIAMELGANGYLTKPFKEAELLSLLQQSGLSVLI